MAIYLEIGKQMLTAIKNKNDISRDILRYIKGEIERASISEKKKPSDEFCMQILKKMIKQTEESKMFAEKFTRPLMARTCIEEIKIYKSFLPKEMTEDELRILVNKVIVDSGAKTNKEFGKVMSILKNTIKGQNMQLMSKIVNETLK